jgi:hypothetical protein
MKRVLGRVLLAQKDLFLRLRAVALGVRVVYGVIEIGGPEVDEVLLKQTYRLFVCAQLLISNMVVSGVVRHLVPVRLGRLHKGLHLGLLVLLLDG